MSSRPADTLLMPDEKEGHLPAREDLTLSGASALDVKRSASLVRRGLEQARQLTESAEFPKRVSVTICLLKHVPGKGTLILKDGMQSEISAWEVQLLFSQEAISMIGEYPDEWCAMVTDDRGERAVGKRQEQAPLPGVSDWIRALLIHRWPFARRFAGARLKERKPLPPLTPASERVAERMLLDLLTADLADSEYFATLENLFLFYAHADERSLAANIGQILLESTDDAETRAVAYWQLGQLAEQDGQVQLAHQYYVEGLALRPQDKAIAYWLHNNAGYCLTALARNREAARYCRLAIGIDPGRPNAFKNLGISLECQGDLVGAARAYIDATKADARDPRAFHLLEKLVAGHPELGSRFPGILKELETCRRATTDPPDG